MIIILPQVLLDILHKIQDAGFEAFVVGGFVRDMLLGKESSDYDITCSAEPNDIERIFESFVTSTIGKRHGTIGVLYQAIWFEITSYRSDSSYSDYRRPDQVKFVKSLNEDLVRRDFTINALAINSDGELIDIIDGYNDIQQKIIRCVGDPKLRFQEDALRILRALRLASTLNFQIEENTALSIHSQSELILKIAIERVVIEFQKILQAKNCSPILIKYHDVFAQFLPEIDTLSYEDINCIDQCQSNEQKMCLLYARVTIEKATLSLKKLRYSNVFIQSVLDERAHLYQIAHTDYELKKWLSISSANRVYDVLGLQNLLGLNQEALKQEGLIQKMIKNDVCIHLKQLTVKGQDIINCGYKGSQIGEILNQILDKVMKNELSNEKDAILSYVKKLHA